MITLARGLFAALVLAVVVGCAGNKPMPAPDAEHAVVILGQQTFTRGDKEVKRYPQESTFEMWGPGTTKVVPDGETLGLFPQALVTDEEEWGALGVFDRWDYDTRFRTHLFGPFEAGNCYLAYFEPVKLDKAVRYRSREYDYKLAPRIETVECNKESYPEKNFTLK